MPKTLHSDFKNILIFRLGHLGDTLVSLPAFWAVKKAYPQAKMTLLSNADAVNPNYVSARSVLPEKDLFDDWLVYPSNLSRFNQVKSYAELFFEIKSKKFDALIYLMTRNRPKSFIKRDTAFFKLAGIKKIIGAKYLAGNTLDRQSPRPLPTVEREQEFLLKCLEYEIFPMQPKETLKPELLLSEIEKKDAENWLKQKCGDLRREKTLIAVAPASKWESKIWAEENFYEVVKRLIAEKNVIPVIFGGAEEKEKGNRLIHRWKKGVNAAGELNIRQSAAALRSCRIYLGNDTGTMHLAASVGVACVATFAAVDWRGRWHPFGENHRIFRETVKCEGCLLQICPFDNLCLQKISSEGVLQACFELLENV